jgi:hypothetical protein
MPRARKTQGKKLNIKVTREHKGKIKIFVMFNEFRVKKIMPRFNSVRP